MVNTLMATLRGHDSPPLPANSVSQSTDFFTPFSYLPRTPGQGNIIGKPGRMAHILCVSCYHLSCT